MLQSVQTKDNRRSIKEQTWKRLEKDKLACKDDVTNSLQPLDEKLSIRVAEPEEQTGKAFNGRKFEKRRKTEMGRRELPFSPKLQAVMSTPPSYSIKTGWMGEPMTAISQAVCACMNMTGTSQQPTMRQVGRVGNELINLHMRTIGKRGR